MNIGLLPLDERPANTRYPAMIAAIAGARLTLPPAALLCAQRRPADCAALAAWLGDLAPQLDGLIVACELLGYGGLVASRTSDEPASAILARLDTLRAIKRQHPTLPIYGFSVITRVSNANDATEEPQEWATYGAQLYQLSQLLDRQEQGAAVAGELAALNAAIPAAHRQRFLRRRLRNHTVNLAAVQMLAEGVFDLLVLSSDDTSPYGLPSREKRWLASWAALLGLASPALRLPEMEPRRTRRTRRSDKKRPHGLEIRRQASGVKGQSDNVAVRHRHRPPSTSPPRRLTASPPHAARLLMYPGADEIGCVLLARLLNERAGVTPRFGVAYAPPEAAANVAAYEDGPIRVTVERQIRALGGVLAADADSADMHIAVNAPLARRSEWQPAFAAEERESRWAALQALVADIAERQARGQPVIVADVAYPNGADPALVALLQRQIALPALAAYGAWNTAGNTIGTALAQGCAAQFIASDAQRAAHERFLLHRFVEDCGYQQRARAEVRWWLRATHGADEPTPATLPATRARIEAQLAAYITELPGFAERYKLAPGSVRLPWGRTFEVDFDLTDEQG